MAAIGDFSYPKLCRKNNRVTKLSQVDNQGFQQKCEQILKDRYAKNMRASYPYVEHQAHRGTIAAAWVAFWGLSEEEADTTERSNKNT